MTERGLAGFSETTRVTPLSRTLPLNSFEVAKTLRLMQVPLAEFADVLGLSVSSVRKWIATGVVPKVRTESVLRALEEFRASEHLRGIPLSPAELDCEQHWLARLHAKREALLREVAEIDAIINAQHAFPRDSGHTN
jgi:hypothetical protein